MTTMDDLYANLEEYWRKLCDIIEKNGWAIQPVIGTDKTPDYCYTVGLSKYGKPEIMTIGLPPDIAQIIVNDSARKLLLGEISIDPLQPIKEIANLPVAFRCDNETHKPLQKLARMADRWSGEQGLAQPEVIQLIYPDKRGLFPWDEGCDAQIAQLQDPDWLTREEYADRHGGSHRLH